MEFDHVKNHHAKFGDIPDRTPLTPTLTFDEAVTDLITREPRLAESAAEVSRLYSMDHTFAMARSAEQSITERAQKAIEKFLTDHTPAEALSKSIQEIGGFSQAYGDTVFRTNVATAYNQGRIDQASDPDLADIIVGFRYEGIADARTRSNHRAGFGTVASTTDDLWKTFRPPNGYNCRCSLEYVSRFEAERLGLWKDGKLIPSYSSSNLKPDPGFKSESVFS
jgi:SPP1 gp7 family putative phage head morphogenesis protein